MLKPDSHSDVVELCRWAEINPANYRRFESPLTSDTAEQPKTEASFAENHIEASNAADQNQSSTGIQSATTVPTDWNSTPFHRSPMQRQLVTLTNVHDRAAAEPSVLPLMSGVGGCGVTSILATLGRALSILGERVLLVDTESSSTLAFSYEARTQGRGLLLSMDPVSRFEGEVHVLRTSSAVPTVALADSTCFHRAMAELAGRLDRVIIAGGELLIPALKGQHSTAKNICIVVVTPELRSALAAPGILRSFASDVEPWFLLNRFDEENSRHVQFRLQLQHSLGASLLPFHIPQSSSLEDALQKGLTVLDLAPQAAIADAFFELAEWYRTKCGVRTSSFHASEETQLAV